MKGRLGPVGALLRVASVQTEHPTQFVVEQLTQTRRQRQHVQRVYAVRHQAAKASAAQVQQRGGGGARPDDLHAALGCSGARHRIKPLVVQLRGCDTWTEEEKRAQFDALQQLF